MATFTGLAIRTVGTNYVLTAESDGLSPDSSEAFNITPGNPTKLAFTTDPASTYTADDTFGVVVTAYDAYDNVATDDTVSVGLTRTGPVATLVGTNPVNTVNGVATFSGLAIRKVGAGYGLDASSSWLNAYERSIQHHAGQSDQARLHHRSRLDLHRRRHIWRGRDGL